MAYARRGTDNGWYIYYFHSDSKEPLLFVQGPHRPNSGVGGREQFSFREIKVILETGNFEGIPSYTPEDRPILVRAFSEFVKDVESEGRAG